LAAGLWGLAGRGRGALLAVAAGPVAVACGGTAAGRGGRLGRAGVAAELELPLRRRLLLRPGRRGGRGRRGVVTGGLGPLDPGLRPSGLVLAALPAALGRRLARRLLAAPRGAAGPGPRRRGPPAGRLAGGLDAGELEDELDDLGLAGPRRRLGAEGLGDRDELLAVLALQGGPFEGAGLHAHRWLSPHCWLGGGRLGGRAPAEAVWG